MSSRPGGSIRWFSVKVDSRDSYFRTEFMDRRMLINAVHPEECRIAIVEDHNLVELEIESNVGRKLKGNISQVGYP